MTANEAIDWIHEMERHGLRFIITGAGCVIHIPPGLTDPQTFPLGQEAARILALMGITEGFNYVTADDSQGLPDPSGQSLHRRA